MKSPLLALVASIILYGTPASAEPTRHAFNISIRGINAGVMDIRYDGNGTQYSATGKVTTSKFLSRFVKFGYSGQASGVNNGSGLEPANYAATGFNKKGTITVRMRYKNKRPELLEYTPKRDPRPTDVKVSDQVGAVDLVSASFMIVRDVTLEELCSKTVEIFDGRKRSRIWLGKPDVNGKSASCNGAYERLGGFNLDDLEEDGTVFPFTSRFELQKDGTYRLMRVATESVVGPAVLTRRN